MGSSIDSSETLQVHRLLDTMASIRADYHNHGCSLDPAVCALAVYRLGRWSLSGRSPVHWIASKAYAVVSPLVRVATNMTVDRTTTIGSDPILQSGGTISVHPHATIGARVVLMRGVTLGATPDGGVPTIGDDVVIGAGAVVIGRVVVGHGARIAANSLVISDVPPQHVAMGVPARHRPLAKERSVSR